jgi:hypothetical protein
MIFDFLQKMRNHWLALLQVHLIFVLLGVACFALWACSSTRVYGRAAVFVINILAGRSVNLRPVAVLREHP